jgi:histidyl-tRNA synthetase
MNETPKRKLIEPRTLKGFRDLLPRDAIIKNRMQTILSKVFESFGFVPVQTPHLEYAECLLGDAGNEIQKQVYRFQDNGKRDVALRFDLTVPFARFIAQHKNEVGLPFKRWVIGNVFRGENTQAGRYREFTQCDFDFVGTESLGADAEIVQVICASMQALGIHEFQIRINNRKVLNGLAAALGVQDKIGSILIEIDKLEKVGEPIVREALMTSVGLSDVQANEFLAFVSLSSSDLSSSELLTRTSSYRERHELLAQGLGELETVLQLLAKAGIEDPTVRLDLSIARGLGYYTGIVYETKLLKAAAIRSVCSGGRYDNLTETFQKERCPGVGASVGIDRLIAALDQLGLLPTTATSAKVLITLPAPERLADAIALGAALRSQQLDVEVYPEPHKMKKQIDYARRAGHPFLITFPQTGEAVLENLKTGERVPFGDAAAAAKLLKEN